MLEKRTNVLDSTPKVLYEIGIYCFSILEAINVAGTTIIRDGLKTFDTL